MEYKANLTYCGYPERFGNYVHKWSVTTDDPDEERVRDWCFKNLSKREFVSKNAYELGRLKKGADFYYSGFYTLTKIDGGWEFATSEPYCD